MFKNPLKPDDLTKPNAVPKTDSPIPKVSVIQKEHVPKNVKAFTDVIREATDLISQGKSKVEVVKVIYPKIANETKEVIELAFRQGVGLTEKGASTYRYNIIRATKKKS